MTRIQYQAFFASLRKKILTREQLVQQLISEELEKVSSLVQNNVLDCNKQLSTLHKFKFETHQAMQFLQSEDEEVHAL